MKWKPGVMISAILLSVLVMCHSGGDDDDDDNGNHHDKQYRSAGVSGASAFPSTSICGSYAHGQPVYDHEEAKGRDDVPGGVPCKLEGQLP